MQADMTSIFLFILVFAGAGFVTGWWKRKSAKRVFASLDFVQIMSGENKLVAVGKKIGHFDADGTEVMAFVGAVELSAFEIEMRQRYETSSALFKEEEKTFLPLRFLIDPREDCTLRALASKKIRDRMNSLATPELGGTVSSSSVVIADTKEARNEFEVLWSGVTPASRNETNL